MNEISRKKKREETIRSIKLLKMVLGPLVLLSVIVGGVYGLLNGDKLFKTGEPQKQTNSLIVKERKYTDVSNWSEFIDALSNKKLTEINIKNDIIVPQTEKKLKNTQTTTVTPTSIFHYDGTLKTE